MKRTTIFADDRLLSELKEVSREENKSIADIGQSAEVVFVNSLADRELMLGHFDTVDLKRCIEWLGIFDDANIGFVDASIVAMAERLKINKILTTDRRYFSIMKPKHCKEFTLLP